MRRSGSVCLIGFLFTVLTVATVTSLMFYFTVLRKPSVSTIVTENDKIISPKTDVKNDRKNDLTDHRSHAKPGAFYEEVDFKGVGNVSIEMDGTQSHTHYYDEGPPVVVGKLVSMVWFDNETHAVLGTGANPKIEFETGTHVVGLTVADNTRDTHTAYTVVNIKSSKFEGAYCYYYFGNSAPNNIKAGKPADFAAVAKTINFEEAEDFPDEVKEKRFSMRCVFIADFSPGVFVQFQHSDRQGLKFVVDGREQLLNPTDVGSTFIPKAREEQKTCELIFSPANIDSAQLVLKSGVADPVHDFSKIVPIVLKLDPDSSTKEGGGTMKIRGSGLNTNVTVVFGNKIVGANAVSEEGDSISIIVPSSDDSGHTVPVLVRNDNGRSKTLYFTYSSTGKVPVKFVERDIDFSAISEELKKWLSTGITGIKYGPDHKYYVTSLNGHVSSFELDENLKVRPSICRSNSLGLHRRPLGLAFNYADKKVRVYVSTSIFKWKQNQLITGPLAWANGQIHVLETNRGGLCLAETSDSPIITGLPVSNHDHGVNGMVFDDDGNLRIQVGGFTNGGHNEPKGQNLGGIDENPLSAASLIAYVSKGNLFDGKIKYSPTNPSTARQVGGKDVQVYMSGWRNSFGINIHSNGHVYATDNGPSAGFGDKSMDCGKHEPFTSEKDNLDKLGKVVKGMYGGHPNRNRGQTDPQQCRFYGLTETNPTGNYRPPITKLRSSTNGLLEYTADIFDGELKGDLVLSMFKTDESPGVLWRVSLDGNGNAKDAPEALGKKSGLSIEMTPEGALIMPQVYGGQYAVFVPSVAKSSKEKFISVMPPRGSFRGGNRVKVTGKNIRKGAVAYFDGKPCTNVKDASKSSFTCVVPSGVSGRPVKVQLGKGEEGKTVSKGGNDYKYMNI